MGWGGGAEWAGGPRDPSPAPRPPLVVLGAGEALGGQEAESPFWSLDGADPFVSLHPSPFISFFLLFSLQPPFFGLPPRLPAVEIRLGARWRETGSVFHLPPPFFPWVFPPPLDPLPPAAPSLRPEAASRMGEPQEGPGGLRGFSLDKEFLRSPKGVVMEAELGLSFLVFLLLTASISAYMGAALLEVLVTLAFLGLRATHYYERLTRVNWPCLLSPR
ncbi:CKLF-like MARVEL transmembrane domain-containing protein 5 isoform X1 [Podarcis muralis]